MTRRTSYPQEVRERAVRMVFEHGGEPLSQRAAITSIAMKFGVSSETLLKWVRRVEMDGGQRLGLTTEGRERLKVLERQNPGAPQGQPDAQVQNGFLFGAEPNRQPSR